jgi:hypothetical protein
MAGRRRVPLVSRSSLVRSRDSRGISVIQLWRHLLDVVMTTGRRMGTTYSCAQDVGDRLHYLFVPID